MTLHVKDRVYIIAEAGVNHNGSLELALQLVDAAAEAGADAVKFQTFRAEALVSKTAPKAAYQKNTTGASESQFEMLKKLELDETAHKTLSAHCLLRDILFLSTAFDEESLNFLHRIINVPMIKIPSGEITNGPLLLAAAQTNKPIILSTGMSTLKEVRAALEVIAFGYTGKKKKPSLPSFREAYRSSRGQRALKSRVTLLHCTTEYPAPFQDVNLRAMDTLRETFNLPVGYSDHTEGIAVPIAAVAMGAALIEKHFTINRTMPGPDHKASLEPDELKQMVKAVRDIELALGNGKKLPVPGEIMNISIVRKSIVARHDICPGEPFTPENITCKRPAKGLSPMRYWEVLGKRAKRAFQKNEVITP